MSDRTPFFLFEGVVSLYPSDASGQALTGAAIWLGACVNGLRASDRLTALRLGASGDRYKTVVHVDEEHELTFDRVWIVQKSAPGLFVPGRNQQYVLDIVWTDRGTWYRRTYFGVTGSLAELASRGVLEFDQKQSFVAQSFKDGGGTVGGGQVYVPTAPGGAPQPVAFFHENPMPVGSYLLGRYRWESAVTINSASVLAWACQTTPTVLTLEVNGTLTAHTLTIPVGAANTEVSAAQTFTGLTLNAGDAVRWQVTSGPASGVDAAWQVALVMLITV